MGAFLGDYDAGRLVVGGGEGKKLSGESVGK